ncbi:sterol 3-beta-glucosyltransferase UGT80A2 isoform X1 [Selaginella moellendorffii]|uniref:sterol 3-beta-glucosyltransferase UGT80A2 isoform X1 n=1 Tax=Selaginella moellendorffii TaxID=88036 RepID=UPI000D1CAF20|nr:sterol 3-beta-glucosyltransferase UGT80A2 isoform X1 [Selaginella moellendorffii]|eukprot:XP_024534763.1 sterol 3-beta-glucosyltransferase UGT80A2 isoform X1 [Selaginella moellendorffii]
MATCNVGVFMAFGTLGDILPLAYVAIALARATTKYSITFITHDSHQVLKALLLPAGIVLRSVSTPAVLTPEQKRDSFPDSLTSGNTVPKCEVSLIRARRVEIHMEECLDAIESQESNGTISFIAINFFALVGLSEFTITLLPVYRFLRQEGWHIAELLNVRFIVLAPYVMPYSAPASFERSFRQVYPRLYKRLQRASAEEVGWKDVTHWMWPLFTDRWTSWRVRKLRLSACPLTDPVTELPVHDWPRSVPLLYGFSEKVVECPGYWPSSVRVCGFWLPPDRGVSGTTHLAPKLAEFLLRSADSKPVFIGLSSITSMGFLQNPLGMLQVVTDVLKAVNMRGVLFTAGHPSLEAVVTSAAGLATSCLEKEGLTLDHNLFCYSGYVPYNDLFPKCSVVIHHGGSGTTAACLHAGVPQVICPFILDQFYWAERMSWLGVSPQPLKPYHLVPDATKLEISGAVDAVTLAVREALTDRIKTNAMELASSINDEDGCSRAVQIIMEETP